MAVVPRKRKGGRLVYGVLTSWPGGKPYWELVGPNKREAEQRDRQRKREVKDGTFRPGQLSAEATIGAHLSGWLAARSNTSADMERTMLRHVQAVAWFIGTPMSEVRPKHVLKLIDHLEKHTAMSPKYLSNAMGVVRVFFRDMVIDDVIAATPYVVPKDRLSRRGKKRTPYTPAELEALVSEVVGERQQVFNALLFFLGGRLGEICGLRWGDWDEAPRPLGAMRIERQYGGQETKTGRGRTAPVHPFLAQLLTAWRERWRIYHLRRPGPSDYIVPGIDGEFLARSSAYKAWRLACVAAKVENRTVHSTRHTFITLTQRGGADRRLVERITHNPKDEIIDVYTTHEWEAFCRVVLALDSVRASNGAPNSGSPGQSGDVATSSCLPDSRQCAQLPEVNMVRVLESEPRISPRLVKASSGASNGWFGPLPPPAVAARFDLPEGWL